jgi:hypothetical protein
VLFVYAMQAGGRSATLGALQQVDAGALAG